jgi:hypothetical protein
MGPCNFCGFCSGYACYNYSYRTGSATAGEPASRRRVKARISLAPGRIERFAGMI